MAARPEIVELLMDMTVDTTTKKFTHRDGRLFTPEEIDLVGQASRHELDAARDILEAQVDFHESQSRDMDRLMEITKPYFDKQAKGATLNQVLPTMPTVERAEAEQLMDRLAPGGGFVFGGGA